LLWLLEGSRLDGSRFPGTKSSGGRKDLINAEKTKEQVLYCLGSRPRRKEHLYGFFVLLLPVPENKGAVGLFLPGTEISTYY
jgi:hypothetical protein